MKVLIVSDTHRKHENYLEALEQTGPVDMVIHCGDVEGGEYLIEEAAGCPVEIIQGNNDYFSELPREKEFQLGKYRVLLVHGHQYRVNFGFEELAQEARSRGIDIVMYGHTHRPLIVQEAGLTVVNPGSLTYPRQEGKQPSCVLMQTDREGNASFEIIYPLERKKG